MVATNRGGAATLVRVVALLAHLATLPLHLVAGLVAPAPAVALLVTAWSGLLVVALRLGRSRPGLTLLVPVASVVVWAVVVTAGERLFGWTA